MRCIAVFVGINHASAVSSIGVCLGYHLGCGKAYCHCGQVLVLIGSSLYLVQGSVFASRNTGVRFLGPFTHLRTHPPSCLLPC